MRGTPEPPADDLAFRTEQRDRARLQLGEYLCNLASALPEVFKDDLKSFRARTQTSQDKRINQLLAHLYDRGANGRRAELAGRPKGLPGDRAISRWFIGETAPNGAQEQGAFKALVSHLKRQGETRGIQIPEPNGSLDRTLAAARSRVPSKSAPQEAGLEPSIPPPADLPAQTVPTAQPGSNSQPEGDANPESTGEPRRKPFWRRTLVLAAVIIVLCGAVVVVVKLSKQSTSPSETAAGPTTSPPVTAGTSAAAASAAASIASRAAASASSVEARVFAAASAERYRLTLLLSNQLSEEQTVDSLDLVITGAGVACAELPPVVLLEVEGVVVASDEQITGEGATGSGLIVDGSVSAGSGPASGYEVPIKGTYNYGCAWNQLQLKVAPPAVILERLTTTPIVIDVPKIIKILLRIDDVHGGALTERVPVPEGRQETLPSITNLYSGRQDQWVAFRVSATTSDGSHIDSCYMLAGAESDETTGPQDCNGIKFRRQIYISSGQLTDEPIEGEAGSASTSGTLSTDASTADPAITSGP